MAHHCRNGDLLSDIIDVQNVLVKQIEAAVYPNGTTDYSVTKSNIIVHAGWPASASLDENLRAGVSRVSVFPKPEERNTTRMRLAQIELDLEVMRALIMTNAAIVARGDTPTMEASMSKVWTTELRYTMSNAGVDLLGRAGVIAAESDSAEITGGEMERAYRASPFLRFGGGTNEVQRDIIARRGLGLPR